MNDEEDKEESHERRKLSDSRYDGPEKRTYARLSPEDIEAIAKRAAELAAPTAAQIVESNFTLQVGKVTIRGFLYLCGLGGAALFAWLGLSGKIPFGK